jgi:hypothetical protein
MKEGANASYPNPARVPRYSLLFVVKSDVLTGHAYKNWKRRWFVADAATGTITYYPSQEVLLDTHPLSRSLDKFGGSVSDYTRTVRLLWARLIS